MNFYSLLGLPETASEADIERAYRRLARRYHPGVNPGDRLAEQMYQQIQAAYRVLADAERRRAYDRGTRVAPEAPVQASVAFEGFDFSTPAEGPLAATFSELFADVFRHAAGTVNAPARGADLELAIRISFLDAICGSDVPISITRQDRCVSCRGQGHVARHEAACPVCQGEGMRRWARGHMVFSRACDVCAGQGRLASTPCRVCRGTGTGVRHEVVTLHIPSGTDSNARLAVPGRGHAGPLGGGPGDLYVTVDVAPHPHFRREGRDVVVTVPLLVHEAALGAAIEVPTLNGWALMQIPAGTGSGQRFRLRDHRLGVEAEASRAVADLVVETEIVLPPQLDDRSRELLEEFGRLNHEDVRRQRFEPS
ncbi:MAG: DnaJ C-terminal domain-containing protein [Vicinamibacterales bacterium]